MIFYVSFCNVSWVFVDASEELFRIITSVFAAIFPVVYWVNAVLEQIFIQFVYFHKTVGGHLSIFILVAINLAWAHACKVSLGLLDVFLGDFLLAIQRDVDGDIWNLRLLHNLYFLFFNYFLAHSRCERFLLGEVILVMVFRFAVNVG